MRRTVFFVCIVLALFCFVSCDHLSSAKYDVSVKNLPDKISSNISSDGTSISMALPALPDAYAARDAGNTGINENQHFRVSLISESNSIQSLTGCAGETITFENLTPGNYTMKCKAWDDYSGLHYTGTQNVTVETGSNEAILELNFITEDDHIKLNPTENGVEITIKGIDFDKINGISVSEYASGLRFTLDDSKKSEITADGKSTYTLNWPFAPSKVNGTSINCYVFKCDISNSDNSVEEEIVCCAKKDNLPAIDFANYDRITTKYEENGSRRDVYFENISLDTIRQTVTNEVTASRIQKFSALMELWAYKSDNETEWIDTNVIDLPASGSFIPEENDDFQQNCAALFQGNKVDFLDFAGEDATTVNARLAAYGKVLPVLLWRFTMTDVPYGWFELHPISAPFTYTPVSPVSGKVQAVDITNGQSQDILYTNGKPVLTVEKKDDIFSLTVNVPDHTTYMQIEEVNSGNSYHFTQKQGDEGVLICSGQEVTIPWAFRDEAGSYVFHIMYDAYGYKVGSASVTSDSVTGAEFVYNYDSCKGGPVLQQDVIIDSTTFTLKMPGNRKIGDYSLPDETQSGIYTIDDPTVVYSLCFLNGSYDTYDMRLRVGDPDLQGITEINVLEIEDNTTKYPLYFCNNDEYQQNGFALYKDYYDPQTGAKTIEGIYNKTGLSGRPGMYTTGAIAFYLYDDDGVLLDSGRTDVWYGEYRLPLWSRNWDYNGEYPTPN